MGSNLYFYGEDANQVANLIGEGVA